MTETKTLASEFSQLLSHRAQEVEAAITEFVEADPDIPDRLREAMLYSLQAGGKRLRPVIVVLACEACGGQSDQAIPAAVAMEMIHTFSLIHDDLPAMDDDDLRRGKPTNHKVFGEAMAILAGDALVTNAFEVIAKGATSDRQVRQLVIELAQGSGASGMIGGQVLDMIGEHQTADLEKVCDIHTYKTAMMFRAAARMGAISADADQKIVDSLGEYGLKSGLAFQIVDDLLDISSTPQELGKQTQKDHDAGKLTWPGIAGIEAARSQVDRLTQEAVASLSELKCGGEILRQLTLSLVQRKN